MQMRLNLASHFLGNVYYLQVFNTKYIRSLVNDAMIVMLTEHYNV